MGVPKVVAKKFGLRSWRIGAAGQSLINLALRDRGIPTDDHIDTVARMLGHGSVTAETFHSYIGPMAHRVMDVANVLFGREEGSASGIADMEARIAIMTQYRKFASPDVGVIQGRQNGLSLVPNRLPPSILSLVEAAPDVAAAKMTLDLAFGNVRRAKLGVDYGVKKSGEVDIEQSKLILEEERAQYLHIRRNAGTRVSKSSVVYGRLRQLPPSDILNLSPDIRSITLPLLRQYSSHEEADEVGKKRLRQR